MEEQAPALPYLLVRSLDLQSLTCLPGQAPLLSLLFHVPQLPWLRAFPLATLLEPSATEGYRLSTAHVLLQTAAVEFFEGGENKDCRGSLDLCRAVTLGL